MATSTYGVISSTELYTLDQLAQIFDKGRDWVYDTFIRPVDPQTKKRLSDEDGRPVPGVFHFRKGSSYFIPGQSLLAWIIEHGDRNIE